MCQVKKRELNKIIFYKMYREWDPSLPVLRYAFFSLFQPRGFLLVTHVYLKSGNPFLC